MITKLVSIARGQWHQCRWGGLPVWVRYPTL